VDLRLQALDSREEGLRVHADRGRTRLYRQRAYVRMFTPNLVLSCARYCLEETS
jgi:hypothetical protein